MEYERSHPWLTFQLDRSFRERYELWALLGECQSKCEHIAGVLLEPSKADVLQKLYFAKGVLATNAIEGNTLRLDNALRVVDGEDAGVAASQQYMAKELENSTDAFNSIVRELASNASPSLTTRRICAFNKMILDDTRLNDGVMPGEIRSHSVGVRGYRGAPARDCEALLDRLCTWLDGPEFLTTSRLETAIAIVKAILAHLYLAWIHPFGDGNGRTARLLEFEILMRAGVPTPAAHLLSNHYNATRTEYERQLDRASRSGGDIFPFIDYALEGFVEGLSEQIQQIREYQADTLWRDHVHRSFGATLKPRQSRQKALVLAMSATRETQSVATLLTTSLYSGLASKTAQRDLNDLAEMRLLRRTSRGYVANQRLLEAFRVFRLPQRPTAPLLGAPEEADTSSSLGR